MTLEMSFLLHYQPLPQFFQMLAAAGTTSTMAYSVRVRFCGHYVGTSEPLLTRECIMLKGPIVYCVLIVTIFWV